MAHRREWSDPPPTLHTQVICGPPAWLCTRSAAEMSVSQAAASGDRLASLKALRDALAMSIDETESGRDRAALAARFMDVLSQIDTAEKASAPVKGTPLDELRNRRDARGSESRRGARPAG